MEHVEGNFASIVYIDVNEIKAKLYKAKTKFLEQFILRDKIDQEFEKTCGYHISLSKTLYIKHYQIQGLS